jgi:hypothetical protein
MRASLIFRRAPSCSSRAAALTIFSLIKGSAAPVPDMPTRLSRPPGGGNRAAEFLDAAGVSDGV